MKGAVADVVHRAAGAAHRVGQPGMQRFQGCLVVEAAGDARLIGHDEDVPARFGGEADGVQCAVDPLPARQRADIAVIAVDRAVTVEEQRGASELQGEGGWRPGQVGRKGEVDKSPIRHGRPQPAGGGERRQDVCLQRAGGGQERENVAPQEKDAGADQPRARRVEGGNAVPRQRDGGVMAGARHGAQHDAASIRGRRGFRQQPG